MRNYEITAILKDSAVEETKNGIKEIFAKHSVTLASDEDWGQKKLWHPVGDSSTGHYTHFKCSADAKAIEKIEREFALNMNILRSMVIRLNG